MRLAASLLVLCAACSDPPLDPDRHDPRFHGWWIVEQPLHALYESTGYDFRADGELRLGPSIPDNCSGHLERHCVTGSVANCVPGPQEDPCESALTCVFGDQWSSIDASQLVIAGKCSDDRARDIVIELNADPSSNTEFGGAGGRLISVDGATDWSHDNFDWVFRKCSGDAPCPWFPT